MIPYYVRDKALRRRVWRSRARRFNRHMHRPAALPLDFRVAQPAGRFRHGGITARHDMPVGIDLPRCGPGEEVIGEERDETRRVDPPGGSIARTILLGPQRQGADAQATDMKVVGRRVRRHGGRRGDHGQSEDGKSDGS